MLSISFNSRFTYDTIGGHNGYGYATKRILESLKTLGYHITYNDPKADVGFVFDQPHHTKWYGDQYRISYLPWESTEFPTGPGYRNENGETWLEVLNGSDEVWTPSPLIASWFEECIGVKKPIYVFQHGVDTDSWIPMERDLSGPINFLHIGGEAIRKNALMTKEMFKRAFVDNNNVTLTLKSIASGWRVQMPPGKVNMRTEQFTFKALVEMHRDHHVYVYPSFGEGFGLTPLQAMATGMPAIVPDGWPPYQHLVHPDLIIETKMKRSPRQDVHPGLVLRPNRNHLVDIYRKAYDNIEFYTDHAVSQIPKIQEEYDWLTLTKNTFESLEKRLKSSAS